MDIFGDLFHNKILIHAAFGWVIAQILKLVIGYIREKRFTFTLLISSGGIPSSHSATVTALATSTGNQYGFDSAIFAISFILAFIVMYDAAGVRRAAGEQAKILNKMMRELDEGKMDNMQSELKELIGHTPFQVIVGAVLGIFIPFIIKL